MSGEVGALIGLRGFRRFVGLMNRLEGGNAGGSCSN
jgi:hypothetical protein